MNLVEINELIKKIQRQSGQEKLQENLVSSNPLELFVNWFDAAIHSDLYDPSAMVLATVDEKGFPDTRVVLLKQIKEEGFVFFTNYQSKKGLQLEKNNVAAINFYWPRLVKQIRIRGRVQKISRQESEAYFSSRPRETRIATHASLQSSVIENREALDARVKQFSEQFQDKDVPCPAHWGGYILTPFEYEFFQGRSWRTHDRLLYVLENKQWKLMRLAP